MQHLGLLSFSLLAIGLTITAVKLPGGLNKTFSQRVAGNKLAEVLYSLIFIVALPILYVFFAMWLVPERGLPGIFLWFAAVAVGFQIVCTWVPERGGKMTIAHRILTGISGVALLPMTYLIASSGASASLRHVSWSALFVMLFLLLIALVSQRGNKYALLLQVGYYASFFVVVLLVTYIG